MNKTREELIEDIKKLLKAIKWRGYHTTNWKIDRQGRTFSHQQVGKKWKMVETKLSDDKIKTARTNLISTYLQEKLVEEIKAKKTKHLAEIGVTYES